MARGTEIGRLLVWRAAWLKNHGVRTTRETSLRSWHATEHAVSAALDAIQVHGANGYSNEFPVERYCGMRRRPSSTRDEPAPHAHPGGLRARLPRGPAAPLRAVAGSRLRPLPALAPPMSGARRLGRGAPRTGRDAWAAGGLARRAAILAAARSRWRSWARILFGAWHLLFGWLVKGNPRAGAFGSRWLPSPRRCSAWRLACSSLAPSSAGRSDRFEAGLEEAQVLRLVHHPQAGRRVAGIEAGLDGFGDDIHVRLGINAPRDRETRQLQARRLWSPVSGSRPADTMPRSIDRIPSPGRAAASVWAGNRSWARCG